MMKQRLPKVLSNPVSLIGLVIAVFNTGFIVFLSIVEAFSSRAHPYADLLIWLVLPGLVFIGLILIIIGIKRERRKEQTGEPEEHRLPSIDFNDPVQRKTAVAVLTVFLLLSLLYAFAGYKTYEFTESDTFCARCAIRSILRRTIPILTRSMPRYPAPTATWGRARSISCCTS